MNKYNLKDHAQNLAAIQHIVTALQEELASWGIVTVPTPNIIEISKHIDTLNLRLQPGRGRTKSTALINYFENLKQTYPHVLDDIKLIPEVIKYEITDVRQRIRAIKDIITHLETAYAMVLGPQSTAASAVIQYLRDNAQSITTKELITTFTEIKNFYHLADFDDIELSPVALPATEEQSAENIAAELQTELRGTAIPSFASDAYTAVTKPIVLTEPTLVSSQLNHTAVSPAVM